MWLYNWFYNSKTVLEKNVQSFLKILDIFFFWVLFRSKSLAKILGLVPFFAIWLIMLISFLNDADIKIISEFKDSFGYYPVFPKNQKKWGVKIDGFWLKFYGEKCK